MRLYSNRSWPSNDADSGPHKGCSRRYELGDTGGNVVRQTGRLTSLSQDLLLGVHADGVDLIWGYTEGYTLKPVIIEKGYVGVNRGLMSYGGTDPHRCWIMPTPVYRGLSVLGRDAPDLMANAILV